MLNEQFTEEFAVAHTRLKKVFDPGRGGENPEDPITVQAMPIVLEIPKSTLPQRTELLEAAARAVAATCLDPRAGQDTAYAEALGSWYGARIRKVARRARNAAWERVQTLPGVTVEQGSARARAFVPSPVHLTDPLIGKLQIGGTDLPIDEPGEVVPEIPLIGVDESLGMSVGKAAAQVGHASMLLAAHMPLDWCHRWAEHGFVLQVRHLAADDFSEWSGRASAVPVRDAGYTEVAPGSMTVFADANGF
ncbi:aminoacyl-tRNA hydrolase [Corynebacterium sp. H130]|uniref:aminoacyl-tRNA hydrolase n=1 Tax=Corynebacterium sp. H130 TaxID=3133444 RepID=UPI00309EFA06